jgi:hypothetical protein
LTEGQHDFSAVQGQDPAVEESEILQSVFRCPNPWCTSVKSNLISGRCRDALRICWRPDNVTHERTEPALEILALKLEIMPVAGSGQMRIANRA